MATYNPSNAACWVHTYREGVLSAVGHDLLIRVSAFEIDFDPDSAVIKAEFAATSLRVESAVSGAISDRDKRSIEASIVNDVLHAARYPHIRFESTRIHDKRVEGTLAVHGQSRPISFDVQETPEAWRIEARIHQPDFGIKPFSAMFGALKIKPDVLVKLEIKR